MIRKIIVERQNSETDHLAADLLCSAKEAKLKSMMIMPIEVDLTQALQNKEQHCLQLVDLEFKRIFLRSNPPPVTVTTRINTFLGNPYRPWFATFTGWVYPRYSIILWKKAKPLRQVLKRMPWRHSNTTPGFFSAQVIYEETYIPFTVHSTTLFELMTKIWTKSCQCNKSNGIQVFGTNIRHRLGSKMSLFIGVTSGIGVGSRSGWFFHHSWAKVKTAKLPVLPRIVTSLRKLRSGEIDKSEKKHTDHTVTRYPNHNHCCSLQG